MAKNKFSSKRKQEQEVKELTPEEQEQALKKLRGKKTKSRFYGRVTVDFPHDLYDDMKTLLKEEGRTMKWYILNLVKTDLKNK